MTIDPLSLTLENYYGIDLWFDARPGVRGTKDVVANIDNTDFKYVSGPQALSQELQRMFDLTPMGSCLGDDADLSYGIDWDFVGTANDPRITIPLCKAAIVRAMAHPSFSDRCKLVYLDVQFNPQEPNTLRVLGVIECRGFEGIERWRFGAYALRFLGGLGG